MPRSRPARALRAAHGLCEQLERRRLLSAYSVVDLGTLGGTTSWAFDLNDKNQVVGYSTNSAGEDHAFFFSDVNGNGAADPGEMVDLGTLPGDVASYAYGINERGEVVGTSRSAPPGADGEERAVRFNPGSQPTDLGLVDDAGGRGSTATDVNGAGQIVGGTLSGLDHVPFVRSAGGAVTTFTLPAPFNLWGEARAVNDAGVVVGYSGSVAGDSGFIRSAAGTLTPVGHANAALPYNYASDVNNAGQVVGEGFNAAGDYRAFLWQNGAATDLGTLPGMGGSEAYGVNDAGAVVGRVEQPEGTPGSTHAFLYRDGVMRDLNDLIPAASGWFIADARAINDGGVIAAVAFSPLGQIRAVLLVPAAPVAGRFVFYNHSAFDGRDPAANAGDDTAIAADKQALLGNAPPSAANVTSYSRGINGVMIDLAAVAGEPGAADFEFRAGNGGSPEAWPLAPEPRSITTRRGAGSNGSDRVTIIWSDGAISNEWLQVTVRPTAATGLRAPDVFSFGNLIGDTGDAAPATAGFAVSSRDVLATRARPPAPVVPITDARDFNRDRRVDARDLAIVRSNYGNALILPGTAPAGPAAAASFPVDPGRARPSRRHGSYDLLA